MPDENTPQETTTPETKPAETKPAEAAKPEATKTDPKLAALEKELADLRKFKDKAERDSLTESEKLKKDAEDAKAEALAAKREAVALKHGLPDALAARLQGTTKEELEADAKALAELLPKPTTTPATTGTPAGATTPPPKDTDQIAELTKQLDQATGVKFLQLQRQIAKLKSQGK